MNDLKTARALQHSILGKGRWAAPCGCIFIVWGNFPKKPWIHCETRDHVCHFDCDNAYGPTCLTGWVNKLTAKRVRDDEFDEAWLKANKTYTVTNDLCVRVSKTMGALRYSGLDNLRRDTFGLQYEPEWPPKMFEVFKVAK